MRRFLDIRERATGRFVERIRISDDAISAEEYAAKFEILNPDMQAEVMEAGEEIDANGCLTTQESRRVGLPLVVIGVLLGAILGATAGVSLTIAAYFALPIRHQTNSIDERIANDDALNEALRRHAEAKRRHTEAQVRMHLKKEFSDVKEETRFMD